MDRDQQKLIIELGTNRRLAHDVLFGHRHSHKTPDFHYEMIDDIHSSTPNILFLSFRGSGKSTKQEEATVIEACYGEFRNKVILGSSQTRAIDRLTAIKHELEFNEELIALFGDLVGPVWNEDKIVLTNGVCIQAFGPGQSFRGVKHLEFRPDRLDIDDLEDEENIATPEARAKLRSWLRRVVLPACAPHARTRVYATPLDPDALPMHLRRQEAWKTRVYPIYQLSLDGERVPLWPDLYPLSWIDDRERQYRDDGATQEFAQEYLCMPEDASTKIFTEDMLKVVPRVRTWHPTYAAYDPARSKGLRAATTGHCVFSWIARRLVIWRGGAHMWLPDEILNDIFKVDDEYHPVAIGVESQGLHEFIEQPLRQRGLDRSQPLPVRRLDPPKGQTEFIKSLQPFFRAGEIEWASNIDGEARAQLLSFPTGRRDFPNALAYALMMRPGQPIYEGFSSENVHDELIRVSGEPVWLVVNATQQFTAAALVQVVRGCIRVSADWIREGGPGEVLGDITGRASLEAGAAVRLVCPSRHFADYDLVGLRAAAGKIPVAVRQGGAEVAGREELRSLMTRQYRGVSMVLVAHQARWTLNAFAGGYAQKVERSGLLSLEAVDGPYKVLMEGLESFVALMNLAVADAKDPVHYATAPSGRRYVSAMAGTPESVPTKDAWHEADGNEGERSLTMRRR